MARVKNVQTAFVNYSICSFPGSSGTRNQKIRNLDLRDIRPEVIGWKYQKQ